MKRKGCCSPEQNYTPPCIKNTVQCFQKNSALLRTELFLKKKKKHTKKDPKSPFVTSAAEVIACLRKRPTTH